MNEVFVNQSFLFWEAYFSEVERQATSRIVFKVWEEAIDEMISYDQVYIVSEQVRRDREMAPVEDDGGLFYRR